MADRNARLVQTAGNAPVNISGAEFPGADILVVDDTVESLKLLTEILSAAGYQVRPAERPHLGLQSALAHPPALILLDVRMPEISGFELCRRLKADDRTREVPIIFVSALQDVEDRVQGFQAGGVDFVSKPFEETEVLARVRTHLQLRAMQLSLEDLVAERTAELTQANETLKAEIAERKEAETALQAARVFTDNLIETANVLIIGLDRTGAIRLLNPAAERATGYTKQELAGKNWFEVLVPRESYPQVWQIFEQLPTQGVTVHFENPILTKGGEERIITWSNNPTGAGAKFAGTISFGIDITERRQAEQLLRESEERFRATFEQAAVGIAHVAVDGSFLRLNRKFCDIAGYSLDELLTRTFQDITYPDDLDADLEALRQLLAGEIKSYSIEKRYLRKDNESIWVNLTVSLLRRPSGEPDYFISVVEEITVRKQMEEAEKRLTQRIDAGLRAGNIAWWEMDLPTGHVTFDDRKAEMVGYSPTRFKTFEDFTALLHPEDQACTMQAMYDHLYGGSDAYDVEYRMLCADGTYKWFRDIGSVTERDERTGFMRVIGSVADISSRKEAEQEVSAYQNRLKALAAELTMSEERERRQIAAHLHDEVGQTLAFARIQIATARKAKTEQRRDALLDETSQTLIETIRATRNLVYDLSSPLLNEIGLEAAISEWAGKAIKEQHGLEVQVIDDGQEKPLSEDVETLLFRNARELLTNVVKHANASSVVVSVARVGDTVRVSVADDGDGMDANAAIQKVAREGGFGLFSIQERMSDLGGSLEIVSEPGQGCTFILSAPLAVTVATTIAKVA